MAFQCDAFQQSAFQNDCTAVVAETFSGGWRDYRDETDTERKARIRFERVRLGILPAEPSQPSEPAVGAALVGEYPSASEAGGKRSALPSDTGHPQGVPLPPDPGLALDLAGLYAGAYLDAEIARHFRILEDEDDAAVLLLAIAVLH